jgi:hypothetical protein
VGANEGRSRTVVPRTAPGVPVPLREEFGEIQKRKCCLQVTSLSELTFPAEVLERVLGFLEKTQLKIDHNPERAG